MTTQSRLSPGDNRRETPAERVSREAAVIAEARAEIAAGQGIDDDALESWLDALEFDGNAPLPTPASIVHQ
jgi:hypothetical protein